MNTPTKVLGLGWIAAIDEELVNTHLGVANPSDSYEVAKQKLSALIQWHVNVATDPRVNGGYQLVPVEPTKAMIEVMETTSRMGGIWTVKSVYKAMLESAPKKEDV